MTDPECIQTFDGKHHYRPRRRLNKDREGKTLHPTAKGAFYPVLSCACSKLAPDDEEIRAQLAETDAEKHRQRAAASKLIEHDEKQAKLL